MAMKYCPDCGWRYSDTFCECPFCKGPFCKEEDDSEQENRHGKGRVTQIAAVKKRGILGRLGRFG